MRLHWLSHHFLATTHNVFRPASNSIPRNLDDFNKFVWNLATRYAGKIHSYEIWNEPQNAQFLFPWNDESLSTLARMTTRAYNTIKAVDPHALILAASVLPRPSSGGMQRGLKWMHALGREQYPFHAWTCHIYPEIGQGVDRWNEMLIDVKSAIQSVNAPTRHLWITETTFGLLGDVIPDPEARVYVNGTYHAAGRHFLFW